ncbi:MAG: tetratricopeptide repeat protein [Thermodesulfobacteriota bacterium]
MFKPLVPKTHFLMLIAVWLLSFFLSRNVLAMDGRVQGIVLDESGKPLENVKINLFDSSRGLHYSTQTNKGGKFYKRGIVFSTYEISFELDGYMIVKETIDIQADWTSEMNVRMQKVKVAKGTDFEIGSRYFNEGNYAEAIRYFKKVAEASSNFALAFYNLGLSYLRNGNRDEALASLKKALEIQPDMVTVYLALGECYVQKEMFEEAFRSFNSAISFQPDNPKIYFNLGVIYSKNDKVDEALSAFETAERLDPNFSSNQYQLGLTYLKKGDYEKAISHFEKFLELEPNAPEAAQVRIIIDELRTKK